MKILKIQIPKATKYFKTLALTGVMLCGANNINAQNKCWIPDSFESRTIAENKIKVPYRSFNTTEIEKNNNILTAELDINEIDSIPSPMVIIGKDTVFATIVSDISRNILFYYDSTGKLQKAFSIASGKKSTPTHTGLRKVVRIESYPYKYAYNTKRKSNPKAYGPKVIVLTSIDKNGNNIGSNGEFIHGTNNPNSIGKYASKGCMRLHNNDILTLTNLVKPNQIVKIIK